MKNDFVYGIFFSLGRRRLRSEYANASNIPHGRLISPQTEFFEAPAERNLRRHELKLLHRIFRYLRRVAVYFKAYLPQK